MTALLESWWGQVVLWVAGATTVAGLSLAVGRTIPTNPLLALLLVFVVVGLGITAARPAALAVATMPLLLWGGRIGTGAVDLSLSDAVLFVATIAALIFAPRPFSRELRALLWLTVVYQFSTVFTVVANPFPENTIEWFHAWMLVAGALVVGWTIGRSGHAKVALTLFLIALLVFAASTIAHGLLQVVRGDFSPVYPSWPFPMHKNFVGTVLALGAVLAYSRPAWMGWSRRPALAAFWVLSAGVVFSQSRQALVSMGVALLVVALRGGGVKRSKAILLVVVPALFLVGTLVRDQVAEGGAHNSVFQRLTWFEETLAYWAESPWVGHGLRFWYRPDGLAFQPPNAEIEVLASAGVVGLAGFLTLMLGVLVVLWRLEPLYGTVAVAVVLARLVQGQLDLFWVAVQVPIAFVVAGIAIGVEARDREEAELQALSEARTSVRVTP